MVKIFEKDSKMNAVDDHNNLVGFDTDDDCCSHGGWFINEKEIYEDWDQYDMIGPKEYPGYIFDTMFFKQNVKQEYDDGNALVIFRMVANNKPDLFLHLYNCHNGYYAKGFECSFGDIKEGYL